MMTRTHTRTEALTLLHATLGIWVGIYAFRTYVPTAVWNLSDNLPLYLKGGLAIGVHLLGVIGCLLPVTRGRQSATRLAFVVAAASVLRQIFLGSDVVGSALSLLTWVLWLWWLAAFARNTLARGRWQLVASGLAAAIGLQVGMQAAWHGLDLPMARGPLAVAGALLINAAFALAAWHTRDDASETVEAGSYVLVAFGAAVFLELTLFANVGRIGFISGLDIATTAVLIQVSLTAGILATHFADRRVIVFVCGVATIAATFCAPFVHGAGVAAVLIGQVALIPLLASAAARPATSTSLAFAVGMAILFALLFMFYSHYEWPSLWVASAIIIVLCAIQPPLPVRAARQQLVPAGIALVLAMLGWRNASHDNASDAKAELSILTYNIHQGFDAFGVPGMQKIADEIARADADVIALQEVGRGWTFLGGADLIAYLSYRFPQYRIHYVPVNGQLWGIALMARVPISEANGRAYDAPPGTFRYGYASASFRLGDRAVRFVGTHLTAGLEGNGGDARVEQARQLLSAFTADSTVIIVGDFNAEAHEPPIQTILAAGFSDAGIAGATWPAAAPDVRIDFVFTRGNVRVVSGVVPQTLASDHLPVRALVR